MKPAPRLETERLLLRGWQESDLAPFAALNADPQVCAHLLGPLSRAESDALVQRFTAHFAERGFGFWAVERRADQALLGFVGLRVPDAALPFQPCIEVAWRLDAGFWGQGYASEAARKALAFGFGSLGLGEIVSFTVPANRRSRAVMERLGMTHDAAADFDHPLVPEGHRLRRHVLYRLKREDFPSVPG